MSDKELHKEVVHKVNTLVDDGGKSASKQLLKSISVKVLLTNRALMKKKFIATAIKHADPLFTQIKKIGNGFAEEKINATQS